MPSISDTLDRAFRAAIQAAFGLEADPLIAPSANPQFGDYQSNVAMGLARRVAEATGAKTNPRQVAEQVKAKLALGDVASEVTIAGPGFLNVRLSPAWLATQLDVALADDRLGVPPASPPQTVVVDYSAPNVAKEMHVGHLRSTIIGDALARTLAFLGHNVVRQNHLGDWGTQFGRVILGLWYEAAAVSDGTLARLEDWIRRADAVGKADDAAQRAMLDELVPWHRSRLGDDPDGDVFFIDHVRKAFPDLSRLQTLYRFASTVTEWRAANEPAYELEHAIHGPVRLAKLPSLIASFVQQHKEDDRHRQEGEAWDAAVRSTMAVCNAIYRRLGVQLADPGVQAEPMERGESFYNPMLATVARDLAQRPEIAQASDGALVAFAAGYEAPLIVQKSDGGYGYATTDLAAIRYRVETLKADRIIYVVGTPQSQHFAQVFDVARRIGWARAAQLEHAGFGSVLGEDGKVFRTRGGRTVKLAELLDEAEERALAIVTAKDAEADAERKLPADALPAIAHAVGIGAVKYGDLLRDRVGDYKFSFDAMLAMDGNTAPYLQYAHARIRSIFKKSGAPASAGLHVTALAEPTELALAKTLLRFAPSVEAVARELKPHFLCTYLYELAGAFSSFYASCDVLKSDEPTRSSRLALCELTARTLARGLDLLGIEHPDQM